MVKFLGAWKKRNWFIIWFQKNIQTFIKNILSTRILSNESFYFSPEAKRIRVEKEFCYLVTSLIYKFSYSIPHHDLQNWIYGWKSINQLHFLPSKNPARKKRNEEWLRIFFYKKRKMCLRAESFLDLNSWDFMGKKFLISFLIFCLFW